MRIIIILNARARQQVSRLGFDPAFVTDSLRARLQNKATVAYHLLADNRRRLPSSAYLKEEMTEAEAAGGPPPAPGQRSHPASPRSASSLAPSPRLVVERRWRLGAPSRAHPGAVVQELCRGLAAAGIAWKKGGPYNLRCRAVVAPPPGAPGASQLPAAFGDAPAPMDADTTSMLVDGSPLASPRGSPRASASLLTAGSGAGPGGGAALGREVKFEAQVYRVREGEYALDLQRASGDLFLFLAIASDLLSSLRL